jgi:DNA-binding NtrC family response regulator
MSRLAFKAIHKDSIVRIIFFKTGSDIADNCSRILARMGFDFVRKLAENPEDLTTLFEREKYDLVMTEYAGLDWSWRLALPALRALPEPVPLLVLAHGADVRILMNCVLAGAADCIPIDEIFRLPVSIAA